jgi:hypothetical protein
MSLQITHANFT